MAVVALAGLLCGCGKKKSAGEAETRDVSGEMAAAALRASGHRAKVTIGALRQPAPAGVRSTLETDQIEIQVEDGREREQIERALDAVAERHGLARMGGKEGTGNHWSYGMHDHATQVIELMLPQAAAGAGGGEKQEATEARGAEPKLAVILDDMGNDKEAAASVFAMHVPLTISVLPYHEYSTTTAEEAYRRGLGVMLHMPMIPEPTSAKQEEIELRPGMTAGQVREMVAAMLAGVPHAAGVNNHEGSLATSNAALMEELMPVLKERGLFFIDSRTAVTTVAYETARRDGVKAAYRKVFLDDVATKEAVLAQLAVAEKDARRDGWAIAIGHPHAETIAALAVALPGLGKQGIRLVYAWELAR